MYVHLFIDTKMLGPRLLVVRCPIPPLWGDSEDAEIPGCSSIVETPRDLETVDLLLVIKYR